MAGSIYLPNPNLPCPLLAKEGNRNRGKGHPSLWHAAQAPALRAKGRRGGILSEFHLVAAIPRCVVLLIGP